MMATHTTLAHRLFIDLFSGSYTIIIMSTTSKAKQIAFSPSTNKAIAKLQNEIFGTLPQLNVKTGYQKMKRMHRGHYIARYYPDPIEKSARLVSFCTSSSQLGHAQVLCVVCVRERAPFLLTPCVCFCFQATPGYLSAQEERRQEKLETLRRRGKGPPKKGSGKRQQKKQQQDSCHVSSVLQKSSINFSTQRNHRDSIVLLPSSQVILLCGLRIV